MCSYLASVWARVEQLVALRADPLGKRLVLLPVRVADCARPGQLGQIVDVDVFRVDKAPARGRLVEAARAQGGRGKPGLPPPFPPGARAVCPAAGVLCRWRMCGAGRRGARETVVAIEYIYRKT